MNEQRSAPFFKRVDGGVSKDICAESRGVEAANDKVAGRVEQHRILGAICAVLELGLVGRSDKHLNYMKRNEMRKAGSGMTGMSTEALVDGRELRDNQRVSRSLCQSRHAQWISHDGGRHGLTRCALLGLDLGGLGIIRRRIHVLVRVASSSIERGCSHVVTLPVERVHLSLHRDRLTSFGRLHNGEDLIF